jgi:hypothetical protein
MATKRRSSRRSRRHGSSQRFPDVEYTLPGGRKEVRPSKPGQPVITAMLQLRRALREQYGDDWSLTVLGRGHTLSEQDDLYGERLLGRSGPPPMSKFRR